MDKIRLDLSKDATRGHILDELCALADDGGRRVERAVREAGVPDRRHHDLADVYKTIDGLRGVSEPVLRDMKAIYAILAQAEASVHGCEVGDTHFHEVGDAQAIENVLGICLCVEMLGRPRILATPVQTGSGKVRCAHGLLDIPAPATAAILELGVPIAAEKLEGELCTPTSAAVIYHFACWDQADAGKTSSAKREEGPV